MDIQQKLSPHFTLYEFLTSSTAQRQDHLWKAQMNPPQNIVDNLKYLCETTLEPIRVRFNYPFIITSGYRSPELNKAVGGSATSQHCHGQAADIKISDGFLTDPRTLDLRTQLHKDILDRTGKPLRDNVNANFYLFAHICLDLEQFDVDQVIHEYGLGFGSPAWVHVAASTTRNKRQILALGRYVPASKKKPDTTTALTFGC